MCAFNSHMSRIIFPLTYYFCSTADDYCTGTHYVNDYGATCCGEQGYPCCINCYYCLTPISFTLDIICCPYTMCLNCDCCKQRNDGGVAATI